MTFTAMHPASMATTLGYGSQHQITPLQLAQQIPGLQQQVSPLALMQQEEQILPQEHLVSPVTFWTKVARHSVRYGAPAARQMLESVLYQQLVQQQIQAQIQQQQVQQQIQAQIQQQQVQQQIQAQLQQQLQQQIQQQALPPQVLQALQAIQAQALQIPQAAYAQPYAQAYAAQAYSQPYAAQAYAQQPGQQIPQLGVQSVLPQHVQAAYGQQVPLTMQSLNPLNQAYGQLHQQAAQQVPVPAGAGL
ncbi:hypothetical protein [Microbispora triticiradicis]|uniref:hypothetical protein n=1 Tax=Microbispora triticiradicis TaxID=2200763 RepID=UPI001AD6936B|nr:hypothetical protein [Microbispora triticiradicis]MBO4273446.1 hypothetical protein [Microbispora triticiradicis]